MKSLLFTAILSLRKRSEQILIKFAILLQVRLTHAQTFFRGVASPSDVNIAQISNVSNFSEHKLYFIYSFRSIANQNSVRYSDSTSYFKKYSSSKCKQTVCLHTDLTSTLNWKFPFKKTQLVLSSEMPKILIFIHESKNHVHQIDFLNLASKHVVKGTVQPFD